MSSHSLVQKLKQENVNLPSYSRMHVDLAAQVCVLHCMELYVYSTLGQKGGERNPRNSNPMKQTNKQQE